MHVFVPVSVHVYVAVCVPVSIYVSVPVSVTVSVPVSVPISVHVSVPDSAPVSILVCAPVAVPVAVSVAVPERLRVAVAIQVKERIVQYVAVRRLRGADARAPILCFVGPPGVGKTTLARSVADVLGGLPVQISSLFCQPSFPSILPSHACMVLDVYFF